MSGKVVAGILLAGGAVVGGAFLLGGASAGGYKNVHDLSGKEIKKVDVWYNEPIKVLQVRARGKFVFPGGTSEKLFRDGNTYLMLQLGAYFGKSKDTIENTSGLNVPADIRLNIVQNFDTGYRKVSDVQKVLDIIGTYCYCEAPETREIIPIQDLVLEVIKSKQVGSNVVPEIGAGNIVVEEYSFGNGECIVTFDSPRTLPSGSKQKIEWTTQMLGKNGGIKFSTATLRLIAYDENNIVVGRATKENVTGSGTWEDFLTETVTAKKVSVVLIGETVQGPVSSFSPTESPIQLTGKLTVSVQESV